MSLATSIPALSTPTPCSEVYGFGTVLWVFICAGSMNDLLHTHHWSESPASLGGRERRASFISVPAVDAILGWDSMARAGMQFT